MRTLGQCACIGLREVLPCVHGGSRGSVSAWSVIYDQKSSAILSGGPCYDAGLYGFRCQCCCRRNMHLVRHARIKCILIFFCSASCVRYQIRNVYLSDINGAECKVGEGQRRREVGGSGSVSPCPRNLENTTASYNPSSFNTSSSLPTR